MGEDREHPEKEPEEQPERRSFLLGSGCIAAAVSALAVGPVAGLFAAPLLRSGQGEGQWIPIGPVEQFGEDRTTAEYQFIRQEGWYEATKTRKVMVAREGSEWLVLSTECSHLGCGVTWRPDSQTFYCPCHGGEFNADGSVKTPPPTRPLARLEVRENAETGQLEVKET